MRHAAAVDESLAIRESQRFLTLEGRAQAREVGGHLRDQGVLPDTVLSSPLMRAVQTVELATAALGFAGVIETLPDLSPGGDVHTAAAELSRRSGCTLAVGHEPSISALGALLCGRRSFPPFHRAQVVLIRDGQAVWALAPGDAAPMPVPG